MPNHPSRRNFLRISGLAALATAIPSQLLSAISKVTTVTEQLVTPMPIAPAASLPWETNGAFLAGTEKSANDVLKLGKQILTAQGRQIKHEFPTVYVDDTDNPWIAYTNYTDGTEQLVLSPLNGNTPATPTKISPDTDTSAIMAQAVLWDDKRYAMVWATYIAPGNWAIKASVNRQLFNRINAENSVGMTPTITVDHDKTVWIAWEETAPGAHTCVMLSSLKKGDTQWSKPQVLAARTEGDCRRPALAAARDGGIWYAVDCYTGQFAVNIELGQRALNRDMPAPIAVTHGPGLNIASSISVDQTGRPWLAWQSNVTPEGKIDIARWFKLVVLQPDGKLYEPATPPPGRDYDVTGEVQGFEFPKVYTTPDGRVWITGRASQNFLIQAFGPAGWTDLIRLPKDGWGGRGQTLELALSKDGKEFWSARRDLQNLVLQKITPAPQSTGSGALDLNEWKWPAVKPTMLKKPKFDPQNGYHFFFGDIHGHTWHSDGTGDVDEYFLMRRDYYGEDFCSLTDHDNFVGNALSPSEYEQLHELSAHYNKPGTFATIFGQEWTSGRPPTGDGHHNIYALERDLPLYDHFNKTQDRLSKFKDTLKQRGWLAIPHHVGWTGTNWDEFDTNVTPVIEIVSVHGAYEYFGNTPIMHRSGDINKKWFAQDGWAMGKKFGVIGGTDCHGLKYQHGVCWKEDPFRAGWACVLAKDLTPEAIFEALKQRRCYATSGIFIRIELNMNGHMMGEEFALTAEEIPTIKIDLACESTIEWIEIVRNNKTVYRTGGNGRRNTVTWKDDAPITGKESWYYVRVTCRDGNMAWTSPVWVTLP